MLGMERRVPGSALQRKTAATGRRHAHGDGTRIVERGIEDNGALGRCHRCDEGAEGAEQSNIRHQATMHVEVLLKVMVKIFAAYCGGYAIRYSSCYCTRSPRGSFLSPPLPSLEANSKNHDVPSNVSALRILDALVVVVGCGLPSASRLKGDTMSAGACTPSPTSRSVLRMRRSFRSCDAHLHPISHDAMRMIHRNSSFFSIRGATLRLVHARLNCSPTKSTVIS